MDITKVLPLVTTTMKTKTNAKYIIACVNETKTDVFHLSQFSCHLKHNIQVQINLLVQESCKTDIPGAVVALDILGVPINIQHNVSLQNTAKPSTDSTLVSWVNIYEMKKTTAEYETDDCN